jgi:hypothetical protein
MKTSVSALLALSLVLISTESINAQNNPYNEVSIASPTAASLGKYADIPVNYHTGIPNISIPIYTVKEGPLSLPISLSYHAGGLKVLEPAGWVGANWSLSAGGVITRTVQGAPDERQTSSVYNQTHGYLSDSGYNKYLWIPWDNSGGSYSPNPAFNFRQEWEVFKEGRKDGEPDLFFFNFSGFSGKFYFRDDGAPVMVPEQDVKIEYSYTPGLYKSIDNFTITVPDGTKYFFGKTLDNPNDVDPVEITNPFNADVGLVQGFAISSWYLNKVTSSDGLFSINLSYTAENYSYYTISMFPIEGYSSVDAHKTVKNIVTGVRLNQITFSNGKVDFVPSSTARLDLNGTTTSFVDDANTSAKSLAEIKVSNASETDCKKFVFSYSYFEDNSSPNPPIFYSPTTDRKRLKLNSLQEQSCDGSIILPAHQFEYFTDFVPRRYSFAQDHWGFYNGATSNNKLIPTYTIDEFTEVAGANREASWPAMRGGTLKKIIYPTGGYSEFEFEPNYTWVSYTQKQWAFHFNMSAGYDGSSNPVIQYYDFTVSTNTYKLTFTNSSGGQQAFLKMWKNFGDYSQVLDVFTEPGQVYTTQLTLTPGNYKIQLQKTYAVSGQGALASFEAWTPTLIEKNETVGGLRIKTITHHDGISASNNSVTSYSYLSNGKSTGFLYSRPHYVQIIRNDIWRDIGFAFGPASCFGIVPYYGCTSCNGTATFVKSPAPIRPMETTQGNHIGYNEVKVTQTGNGYSIYKYYGSATADLNTADVSYRSVVTTSCDPNAPNFPFAPLLHEFIRGELKYEGHFNESGQALREVDYIPVYQENQVKTPAFIVSTDPSAVPPPNPPAGWNPMLATFYELVTARKIQTQVIEKLTTPGVGTVQTSSYTYFESAYHNQATRKTSTSSTGEALETKIKYAFDFRVSSCDAISSCYTDYSSAVANAAIQYNLDKSACGSDHTCKWWAWQRYIKVLSDARNTYVNCRKANYTGTTNAYLTCLTNAKNSGDNWLKPILDLQLQGQNPAIETTSWRATKLLSASFTKYDYAVGSSTGLYPNKILSLNLATPSTTFTAANTSGTSITKDSRYTDETLLKFYYGNLAEVTPKAGVTTSYIWGHNNTLPIVKAVGVDHTTLNSAYSAVSGNLSLIRGQSTLTGALLNTYVYNPFVGMTSEADPNARNTSYEYDKLQRLTLARDHDNNILKRICYGYSGQSGDCNTYYNVAQSGNFTRNNCGAGYQGSQVTYTVPAGTYSSTVDQPTANQLAQNDVTANGQAYANTNGTCSPAAQVNVQGYNTKAYSYSVKFINNETGLFYTFTLPAYTDTFEILGQIPQGTYTVEFRKITLPVSATFNVNGFTQTGGIATFTNISVTATTNAYMY